jgi:hypothetical protein
MVKGKATLSVKDKMKTKGLEISSSSNVLAYSSMCEALGLVPTATKIKKAEK